MPLMMIIITMTMMMLMVVVVQPERFTGNRTIRPADRRTLDWICDPGVQ